MPENACRCFVCIVVLLVSAATVCLAGGDESVSGKGQLTIPEVTGRVVDAEGKPIPGVKIWKSQTREPVAISRPDGTFTLRGLHNFEIVGACPAGWTFAAGRLPHSPIELRLHRATRISGRVLDTDGEPLAGVNVQAFFEGSNPELTHAAIPPCESSYDPRSAVTGTDGRFAFESLEPGRFDIQVAGPGEDSSQLVRRRGEPGRGIEGLEFILARKSVPVEGRIVDADGVPVAGASVILERALPSADTQTDSAGEFRFSGILSGKSHLEVRHPDHGWIEKDVEIEERPVRLDLQLPPVTLVQGRIVGADGTPVKKVSLKCGGWWDIDVAPDGTFRFAVPPGEHEISGECFEPRGKTRKRFTARGETVDLELRLVRPGTIGARLTGLPPGDRGAIDIKDRPEGVSFGSEKDLLEIADVPPGTWTLVASDFNGRTVERRVILGEGETVIVGGIDFPPLPAVHGRVLDPAGRPSGPATVTFRQGDREIWVETDSAGSFVTWLREGTWTARAEHEGFGPATTTLEMPGDTPVELPDLRLVQLVTLSGRVLGVPPEVVVPRVTAESEDGEAWSEVDRDNRFHIPGLWPGTWTLSTDIDGRPVRTTFQIPPGVKDFGVDLN